MTQLIAEQEWHATPFQGKTPYERAVLGFKNYWWPAATSRQIGSRPVRRVFGAEPIALFRRNSKVYALIDECPHRGARLSLGKFEFPGSNAISCRFHGWTFNPENGMCIAALTDGPDSPVVGKVRIRTFPIIERKGIVWIWMGRMAPVPLEEDVSKLLLRANTMVKVRQSVVYGNWRYHAEGGLGNHAAMLHRDALSRLLRRTTAISGDRTQKNEIMDDGDDGTYLVTNQQSGRAPTRARQFNYPGLGWWPPQRPWRILVGNFRTPIQGKIRGSGTRLPGYLRIPNFPQKGALYLEWYTPIDKDHYNYFQVSCHWPSNPLSWIFTNLWYHLWAGPRQKGGFNNQDKGMIAAETNFESRYGANRPVPMYRPDADSIDWIQMCNDWARGEGTKWLEQQKARIAVAPQPTQAG